MSLTIWMAFYLLINWSKNMSEDNKVLTKPYVLFEFNEDSEGLGIDLT